MKKNPYLTQNGRARLLDFEVAVGLAPADAAMLLGVSKSIMFKWRCENRPLPRDVRFHMQALESLPKTRLAELIAERVDG